MQAHNTAPAAGPPQIDQRYAMSRCHSKRQLGVEPFSAQWWEGATVAAAPEAPRQISRQVQLEGCVADQYEVPRTGTTVRVLSANGGLPGHAVSHHDGILRPMVRPNQTVQLALERDDSLHCEVSVGTSNLSVGACLNDREP